MRKFLVMLGLWLLATISALAQSSTPQVDAAAAARRLGLEPRDDILTTPMVRRSLEELGREPCDKTAIEQLGRALDRAGYRREAADVQVGFSRACNGHADSLRAAVNVLLKLSDYRTAVAVSTELIKLEPYHDNGYFLRGLAHFDNRDWRKAIEDFVTATELFSPKDRIASVSYTKMSRAYEELGQHCDAIVPLEAWVATNPTRNDNSQVRSMIAALAAKGKCPPASGPEDVFPLQRRGNVLTLAVTINGTRGQFIFDTGATYVSMKKSFADKAKVEIDEGSTVTIHTANGLTTGKLGRAKLIQLKSTKASDVPIIVKADQKGSFGDGIDGLLGMSFLSRFHITMDGQSVRLRPRTGR
jgi:aspartyl protease family protein